MLRRMFMVLLSGTIKDIKIGFMLNGLCLDKDVTTKDTQTLNTTEREVLSLASVGINLRTLEMT